MLAPNAWYEGPDKMTTNQGRVWEYWERQRPTRRIERICDGKSACGVTWRQLDGRRGASFLRFNTDGQITFIREVGETPGWSKFKDNDPGTMKVAFGALDAVDKAFNFFKDWLTTGDDNDQPLRPRYGMAEPKSRRAEDVARYLWEEAQRSEDNAVGRVVAEYSDDATYEDMTFADEAWPRGREALRKFHKDRMANTPVKFRLIFDEVSDGDRSCAVLWHGEYGNRKSPRGITFYELDAAGKVCYVRACYDPTF